MLESKGLTTSDSWQKADAFVYLAQGKGLVSAVYWLEYYEMDTGLIAFFVVGVY